MTSGARRSVALSLAAAAALALLLVGVNRLARGQGQAPVKSAEPAAAPAVRFEEKAAALGVKFRWNEEPRRPMRTLDAIGCGCAFMDFDGDGLQDILLVGEPLCGLFRNIGGERFEDVSRSAGLAEARGPWKGCAVGDADGDGRLDLLLTGYHRLALLRNEDGRWFRDITREAGLDPKNWGDWASSAGFMDLDGDGDLDLVVQNYLVWGPGVREYCKFGAVTMGCPPHVHDPERGRLFRNDGNGAFTDVSARAGMDRVSGAGLVVGFSDANDDGRMDFYLGNDGRNADFLENLGGLKFRNVALANGTAFARSGNALAAMAVDWADYNRDGRLDFVVTAFSNASYSLYRSDGPGTFSDAAAPAGLAGPTYRPLGFGAKFADVDNDGWPDLFIVNGHVYDRVAEVEPGLTFRQPSMLFLNERGRFRDVAPSVPSLAAPILGRGSATGDFDNDGRMDLLAVDYEGGPLLLHNRTETRGHWLKLDLRGRARNRHAYGARVTLRTGSGVWVGEVSPASSYQSSSDPRLHFGLGAVTQVDELTVRWPDGAVETHPTVPVDRILMLEQGKELSEAQATGAPS